MLFSVVLYAFISCRKIPESSENATQKFYKQVQYIKEGGRELGPLGLKHSFSKKRKVNQRHFGSSSLLLTAWLSIAVHASTPRNSPSFPLILRSLAFLTLVCTPMETHFPILKGHLIGLLSKERLQVWSIAFFSHPIWQWYLFWQGK